LLANILSAPSPIFPSNFYKAFPAPDKSSFSISAASKLSESGAQKGATKQAAPRKGAGSVSRKAFLARRAIVIPADALGSLKDANRRFGANRLEKIAGEQRLVELAKGQTPITRRIQGPCAAPPAGSGPVVFCSS
jgi:hypothetical protein